MQADRTLMRLWAPFAVALALLAIAARLIVPAGFMPVVGAGGVQFVLCSGLAAPAGPGDHPAPANGGGGDCPFALASASGDAPLPAVITAPPALPLPVAAAIIGLATTTRIGGIVTRYQPATGPPDRA